MGQDDAINLLQRNLESEQQTLQQVKTLEEQLAATMPRHTAGEDQGMMDRMKSAVSG